MYIYIFQYFSYILEITGISSFEKINEEDLRAILNDCDPIGKSSIKLQN